MTLSTPSTLSHSISSLTAVPALPPLCNSSLSRAHLHLFLQSVAIPLQCYQWIIWYWIPLEKVIPTLESVFIRQLSTTCHSTFSKIYTGCCMIHRLWLACVLWVTAPPAVLGESNVAPTVNSTTSAHVTDGNCTPPTGTTLSSHLATCHLTSSIRSVPSISAISSQSVSLSTSTVALSDSRRDEIVDLMAFESTDDNFAANNASKLS